MMLLPFSANNKLQRLPSSVFVLPCTAAMDDCVMTVWLFSDQLSRRRGSCSGLLLCFSQCCVASSVQLMSYINPVMNW